MDFSLRPRLLLLILLVIHGHGTRGGTLDISVPYLQSLSFLGYMKKFRIVNAASLIHAKIDCIYWIQANEEEEFIMMQEAVERLNHVRDLSLGPYSTGLLSVLEEEELLPSLQFKRKCLNLDTQLDVRVLPVVGCLLESSPDLETLRINMCCPSAKLVLFHPCEFGRKNYWNLHKRMYFKFSLQRVKTLKIIHFKARKHDMEFVQFLLKNARVLEKMIISFPKIGCEGKSIQESLDIAQKFLRFCRLSALDISMKILSFPRGSSDAVILFS